ncbi:MAG: sulfotransferase family 2 domain-containing protein [Proteobacteria bacterium]|nr:sulfotransferase family 2 domain-containing protein [Pseudomonadota bacterium]
MHTQKTAGTSIIHLARARYGEDNVASHADWLSLPRGTVEEKAFVSGHFGFAFVERLLGERYSFTFLRDPIDRIISLYSFCRSQPPEKYAIYRAASRLNLEEFIALGSRFSETPVEQFQCHSMIWNNQAWQLARGWDYKRENVDRDPIILDYDENDIFKLAKANLEKFDYVGFTETFAQDIGIIHQNLGLGDLQSVPHSNASSREFQPALSPRALAAIKAVTQLDQEIYAFAKKLFRRRSRRFWNFRFGI